MDIVFGAVNQASRNAEITRVAIGKSMSPPYSPSPSLMAPFVTQHLKSTTMYPPTANTVPSRRASRMCIRTPFGVARLNPPPLSRPKRQHTNHRITIHSRPMIPPTHHHHHHPYCLFCTLSGLSVLSHASHGMPALPLSFITFLCHCMHVFFSEMGPRLQGGEGV